MTTIAANRSVMAGDSQATDGTGRKSTCTKIFSKQGCLIGFCGALSDGLRFKEAWPEVEGLDVDEGFEALVLAPTGLHHYESSMVRMLIEDDFYAIGSGGDLARAAMYAGASPQKAVRIAAKLDVYTGGAVKSIRLKHGSTNSR